MIETKEQRELREIALKEQFEKDFKELAEFVNSTDDEGKTRGYITIVYPESEYPNWQQLLCMTGQQFIVSPLHDKDHRESYNEDGTWTGEMKKEHYHVLLLWPGPVNGKVAQRVVTRIHGVGCFPCSSITGYGRYMCHLDNPEKAPYNIEDMKAYNGVDLDKILKTETQEMEILCDIYKFISDRKMYIYSDFVDFSRDHNIEWFRLISTKFRENVYRYCRSLEYKIKDQHKDESNRKLSEKLYDEKVNFEAYQEQVAALYENEDFLERQLKKVREKKNNT